jgi:predicted O-methyltransferase YrrM
MSQVPREEGVLLHILARATGARRILEVGMSGGYSTMWLCLAAQMNKGRVTTIEKDSAKVNIARRNFLSAGMTDAIDIQIGDAIRVLPRLDGPFDLVFFDADKPNQIEYLETVLPHVAKGGLILSDNHLTHPDALADYTAYVRSLPGLESMLLPVGNGVEMTWVER